MTRVLTVPQKLGRDKIKKLEIYDLDMFVIL